MDQSRDQIIDEQMNDDGNVGYDDGDDGYDDGFVGNIAVACLAFIAIAIAGLVVLFSSHLTRVEVANKRMIESIKITKERTKNYCSNDQSVWYLHEDGALYPNVLVVYGKAYVITEFTFTAMEVPTKSGFAGVVEGSIDQIRDSYHPYWNELRKKLDKCPDS